ncbi:hypothetical protein LIER_39587 [Lithospermum erythrorhizon]|uniref:Reverse transcriptase zinc-binding domain-containing protein n=1 Tax=Lithospermum erythrorhizon TaxID=34254 RepID=A0AAV3QK38_LITER
MDDRVKGWIFPLGDIACLKEDMFCKRVFDGVWGTEKALTSGKIHSAKSYKFPMQRGARYYPYANLGGRAQGSGSTARNEDGLWKHLWSIKIPPRVKNFIWRCLHNILPTKDKLLKGRLNVDGTCMLCGEDGETLFHILLPCQFSRRFWFSTPWQFDTVACVLWSLWKLRNARVFKTGDADEATLFQQGTSLARSYFEANEQYVPDVRHE